MTDTYSSDLGELAAATTPERPSQPRLGLASLGVANLGDIAQQAQTAAAPTPATFKERFPGPTEADSMRQGAIAPVQERQPAAKPPPQPTPQPPAPPPKPAEHEPFIRSQGDPNAAAWGHDDFVLMGAKKFPGVSPGPYMPQPADYGGLIQNISTVFARIGSPFVALNAMAMGAHAGEFWKAYRQGRLENARISQLKFKNSLTALHERQSQQLREYGALFAAYGPRTENGKFIPGDEDALRSGMHAIANKFGDHNLEQVYLRGGPAAAQRMLSTLNATNQDAGKLLQQLNAQKRGRILDQTIEANERKAAAARNAINPWKLRGAPDSGALPTVEPSAGAAPSGAATTGSAANPDDDPNLARPADPNLQFPNREDTRRPEAAPEAAPPEGPEERPDTTETPDTTDDTTTEEPDTTDTTGQREPAPDERAETAAAEAAPESGAAPTAQQPIRLAQAATGTATDAPRPGEGQAPTPPEEIEKLREAGAAALRKQMAPAAPAAPAAAPGAPAAAPTPPMGQTPESAREWQPSPSILRGARFSDGDRVDEGQVNALAQGLVNGSAQRTTDLKGVPPEVLDLAYARKAQIESDLQRVIGANLKGEDVYRALDKLDPAFSRTLRSYVDGFSPVPNMGPRGQGYIQRVVALGQQIDPRFNQGSYKQRFNAVQTMIGGQAGRTVVSILTADHHVNRLEALINELERTNAWNTNDWLRGSALANQARQGFITQIAPDWAGDPAAKVAINNYRAAVHLVAPEIARAQKGAAPTLAEIRDVENNLNSYNDARSLRAALGTARGLFHDRMNQIGEQWFRQSGGHTQQDMDQLFINFSRGTFSAPPDDPRTHEKTVQPAPIELTGGMSYGEALRQFRQSSAPAAPAAPAAAAPTFSNEDAQRWLRDNPNSPFADRVRRQIEGR